VTLDVLQNTGGFLVKFSSVNVTDDHLSGHDLLVALGNDGNNKVQKNHEDVPLVQEPDEPDE